MQLNLHLQRGSFQQNLQRGGISCNLPLKRSDVLFIHHSELDLPRSILEAATRPTGGAKAGLIFLHLLLKALDTLLYLSYTLLACLVKALSGTRSLRIAEDLGRLRNRGIEDGEALDQCLVSGKRPWRGGNPHAFHSPTRLSSHS
jgi:hypothetical protein